MSVFILGGSSRTQSGGSKKEHGVCSSPVGLGEKVLGHIWGCARCQRGSVPFSMFLGYLENVLDERTKNDE